MIVGRGNLMKLFPDFVDDIQENGIDLRVGEVYVNDDDFSNRIIGCVNDVKYLPTLGKVEPFTIDGEEVYVLEPQTFYFIKTDRPIHIPNGYTQTYAIRSTFTRCGLILMSSVGDNGFNGTLMMGLYNTNKNVSVFVGKNERIIQAVTYQNDGTASQYDGSYQDDEIYEK